jgi:hypothetical protein
MPSLNYILIEQQTHKIREQEIIETAPQQRESGSCLMYRLFSSWFQGLYSMRNTKLKNIIVSKIVSNFWWFLTFKTNLAFLFFFWWDCNLNSGLRTCEAGSLLLEPLLQSILLWLFWRWGLKKCLPGLASNHDSPDSIIPSSWDYRHEPWMPG